LIGNIEDPKFGSAQNKMSFICYTLRCDFRAIAFWLPFDGIVLVFMSNEGENLQHDVVN